MALAHLHGLRKERDKAIAFAERAIALNPNGSAAYALLGNFLTLSGRAEEGVKLIEKALRLDPIPPALYLRYLGEANYFLGRYEDAIEMYERVLKRSPNDLFAHLNLTAAYIGSDREEAARDQAEELLKLDPAFSLDKYAETVLLYIEDKAAVERYIADLRKAGLR